MKLQYTTKPLREMSDEQIRPEMKALCLKISIITGWEIPGNEMLRNILYDQLQLKMRESYNFLNIDEIEFAIREYGTQFEDWGKIFNLSMLSRAISPYLRIKSNVKQLESKLIDIELLDAPDPKSDWAQVIELEYQKFLNNKHNLKLWAWEMYDDCVKYKLIEPDYFTIKEAEAIQILKTIDNEDLAQKKAKRKGDPDAENLSIAAVMEKWNNVYTQERINQWCKRLSVLTLFMEAKKVGMQTLFSFDEVKEDVA